MNYGYVRVSTQTQNVARQMEEMKNQGLLDDNIFIDKQSGKDFERENYQVLKSKLKKDDLLIIKSIDRLGRNYNMIIQEWQEITKKIESDKLRKEQIPAEIEKLTAMMKVASSNLDFEKAIELREQIQKLRKKLEKMNYSAKK